VLLGTATAGASGSYVLRAAGPALALAADPQGYVNLEAEAGPSTWFFVRHVTGNRLTATSESPAAPATVNLPGGRPDVCKTYYQHQLTPAWARVGQLYIWHSATHTTGHFTYSLAQSSSLGVGISASGAVGSYHLDGTVSQSSSQGIKFPTIRNGTNAWDRTKFRTAKYEQICVAGGNVSDTYFVKSNGYAGGASTLHPRTAPVANKCQPYEKGSSYISGNETAVTWSAGFTITAVSFNTEAQTGYDTSAQIVYAFNANRLACGTRGQQPGSARQVVAKK
jgi:hypothetical protein